PKVRVSTLHSLPDSLAIHLRNREILLREMAERISLHPLSATSRAGGHLKDQYHRAVVEEECAEVYVPCGHRAVYPTISPNKRDTARYSVRCMRPRAAGPKGKSSHLP
ncbi:MAG: hypothetical protein J2P36_18685, partial [Ktedonobacteraceae bacterium]|nr:hypothetical protein [Ktedonobacteraceae bacterium]